MLHNLTIPLNFNTCEEVHTTEAQGMGRNQGYVHLWRHKDKKRAGDVAYKIQTEAIQQTSWSVSFDVLYIICSQTLKLYDLKLIKDCIVWCTSG